MNSKREQQRLRKEEKKKKEEETQERRRRRRRRRLPTPTSMSSSSSSLLLLFLRTAAAGVVAGAGCFWTSGTTRTAAAAPPPPAPLLSFLSSQRRRRPSSSSSHPALPRRQKSLPILRASSSPPPLLLLSDLPTPSFVVDVRELDRARHRRRLQNTGTSSKGDDDSSKETEVTTDVTAGVAFPRLTVSARDGSAVQLVPVAPGQDDDEKREPASVQPLSATETEELLSIRGVCYLHSRVIVDDDGGSKERDMDTTATKNAPPRLLSVALDLIDVAMFESVEEDDIEFGNSIDAELVLGLNNHHVGSYYWARSAGAGAAMEAPGIRLECRRRTTTAPMSSSSCRLRWDSDDNTFEQCNSNDGKRSEWTNFLRPDDQVQLVPRRPTDALRRFVCRYEEGDEDESRVYGISSEGRPLGSEPAVVCQWKKTRG